MRVKKLLELKGNQVFSVSSHSTVYEALKIMAEKEIGVLLVMEGEKLIGIFSERDYARKVILSGKKSEETLVGDVMTTDVVSAAPDDKVGKCLSIMAKNHFRHMPVLEENKVIGIFSISDVKSKT